MSEERVVLLDADGRPCGTAPKAEVHHDRTPLHLAFSCYVFDGAGRLLVTRRALHKRTWPGVWTNSCCGHPAPGEPLVEAVRRRVGQELGLALTDLSAVLPRFQYVATMADGTRENELCPVFVARARSQPQPDPDPDPDEVDDAEWVDWAGFRDDVLAGHREVSPWCAEQVPLLAAAEDGEGWFQVAPESELPEL